MKTELIISVEQKLQSLQTQKNINNKEAEIIHIALMLTNIVKEQNRIINECLLKNQSQSEF